MLHQVASNAKRSRLSGRAANTQLFTSNGAMPVAVDQQGACKETDSALNFGHQSKGTKQETGKDRQKAEREGEGERERKREKQRERAQSD